MSFDIKLYLISKRHYVQYLPVVDALPWISFLSCLLVHPEVSNFDVKLESPWCGENNILRQNCNSWYGMAYWKFIPKNTPFSYRLGLFCIISINTFHNFRVDGLPFTIQLWTKLLSRLLLCNICISNCLACLIDDKSSLVQMTEYVNCSLYLWLFPIYIMVKICGTTWLY